MEIIHVILGKNNVRWQYDINRMVYLIANEQKRTGQKVQVWNVTRSKSHNYSASKFPTRFFQGAWLTFQLTEELKNAVLEHPAAVFHLHGAWSPLFYQLSKVFDAHQIRFVMTPHGQYAQPVIEKAMLSRWVYFRLFERHMLERAHKIHADRRDDFDGLQAMYPNAKSFLLNFGFKPRVGLKSKAKNGKFTLGYIGNLDVVEPHMYALLQAFERFQRVYSDSEFWIVGDGRSRKTIERYLHQNKIENVKLLGKRYGEEKDALLSSMHALLYASDGMDIALPVLEAAAHGVPAIVSSSSNIHNDVLQYNAGYCVEMENEEQWVAAMAQIYHTYHRSANEVYRLAATQLLNEGYSWTKLLPKYKSLYS
jgi:glycosyltransferase involved in cell wall biosynthesis